MKNQNDNKFQESLEYQQFQNLEIHNKRLLPATIISAAISVSSFGLDIYKDIVKNSFTSQITTSDLSTVAALTGILALITAFKHDANQKEQSKLLTNIDISNMNAKMLKRFNKLKSIEK